jgi:hypothetical protein
MSFTSIGSFHNIFLYTPQKVVIYVNTNLWIAAGSGTNSLAYSKNGYDWTGIPDSTTIFSTTGYNVAYSAYQDLWVSTGQGTNSLAYSKDGIVWTGVPDSTTIFSTTGYNVAYSTNSPNGPNKDLWLATGQGTNSLAYSKDGYNWTGITAETIFAYYGRGISYSANRDLWIATGLQSHQLLLVSMGLQYHMVVPSRIYGLPLENHQQWPIQKMD